MKDSLQKTQHYDTYSLGIAHAGCNGKCIKLINMFKMSFVCLVSSHRDKAVVHL